jgi:hypothetical protein
MFSGLYDNKVIIKEKVNVPTVYYGGVIYTGTGSLYAEAAIVYGENFTFVGSFQEALQFTGEDFTLINLEGKMMLPSFFDAHTHPDLGSLLDLREIQNTKTVRKPEQYIEHIMQYLKFNPETSCLRGTGWDLADFFDMPPNRNMLDEINSVIPIFIRSSDQHSAWVNSKALEISNIDQYIDIHGELISLDKEGKPSGLLHDEATIVVEQKLPPITVAQYKDLIYRFQNIALKYGITGYMNAMVFPRSNLYNAYREMLTEGKLQTYTVLAFYMTQDSYKEDIMWLTKEITAYNEDVTDDLLSLNVAKFFIDGTVLGQTAYLLEDYIARVGYKGEPIWSADALREAMQLCEKNGLRIHLHVIGDAALRLALDALETVKPNRHSITHLGLVDPSDFQRFAEIDVIAVLNPYWFCKSAVWENSELIQLGRERAERMFPARSFYDAGIKVAAASDYPVTIVPNPLIGIEMAVTRTLIAPWRGELTAEECILNYEQAISVEQAINAFTLTSAFACGLEHITGSIEIGKSADFLIVDKNIFVIHPSEARVLETWFKGELVYKLYKN